MKRKVAVGDYLVTGCLRAVVEKVYTGGWAGSVVDNGELRRATGGRLDYAGRISPRSSWAHDEDQTPDSAVRKSVTLDDSMVSSHGSYAVVTDISLDDDGVAAHWFGVDSQGRSVGGRLSKDQTTHPDSIWRRDGTASRELVMAATHAVVQEEVELPPEGMSKETFLPLLINSIGDISASFKVRESVQKHADNLRVKYDKTKLAAEEEARWVAWRENARRV